MADPAPRLTPHFTADLKKSGITPEVAAANGLYVETDPDKVRDLLKWGEGPVRIGHCLVIPYLDRHGNPTGYHRLKPARPRTGKSDGKLVKYEAPKGSTIHVYFPAGCRAAVADPTAELAVTEGEKKALAASDVYGFSTIAISGVDSWRKKGGKGKVMIDDLAGIAWAGRPVSIVFDSDAVTNTSVLKTESELAAALTAAGAVVKVVRLPEGGAS